MTASPSSATTGTAPTPEQWAIVYSRWRATVVDAARQIKITLPALSAARMAGALKGAYPQATPAELIAALAAAAYAPVATAPAVRAALSQTSQEQMRAGLVASFPALLRAELDAALRAAGYTQTPPFPAWLSFDGSQSAVDLGNPAALNFAGPITIEAWIRPRTTDGLRNIVAHGYVLNPNSEVYFRIAGGRYQFGSWNGTDHVVSVEIPAGDTNRWTHLAGVYDSQSWRLYRDGLLIAANADALGALPVPSSWSIGARGPATERFFAGELCEVRIWSVARSEAEIQSSLWRRVQASEMGLVGYWPINEGVGPSVADRGRSGSPGTIRGAVWQRQPPASLPPTDTALAFNGSTAFARIAASGVLNTLQRATWEAWIYPLAQSGQKKIIWREYPGGVQTLWQDGTIAVGILPGAPPDGWRMVSASGFAPNQWYHVAGVLDGATLRLYVNGDDRGSTACPPLGAGGNQWHLGRWNQPGYDFAGQISEVRIWNVARGPGEIRDAMGQRLLGGESGLIGYWPLSDGFGMRAADQTVNSNHAILQDTVWQTPAPTPYRPYALRLGAGARVAMASSAAYNFGQGDFTLEAWVKTGAAGTLISRKSTDGGAGRGGFLLVLRGDGSFKLATDSGFGFYEILSQPTRALDNQWHHIAGVRQGGQLSLILDGTPLPATVGSNAPTPTDVSNSMRLLIGATDQQQEPFNQFSGTIGEIRVWSVARSRADLWNAMDQRLSGTEPGLVGYWSLDQRTLADSSPTANAGQPAGGVTFQQPGAPLARASVLRAATAAYYPLQSNANDGSGRNRHATINGPVTFERGPAGMAASFTSAGANIQLPSFDRYAARYTIAAWVYLKEYRNIDPQPSDYGTIFGRLSARHNDGQLLFFFYYDNAGQANNQALTVSSRGRLALGRWQHVAVTYDHSTRLFSIYLDRALDMQQNLSDRVAATDQPHLPWFRSLGGWPGTSYAYASTLNGLISDAYLLTMPATPDDLLFLANPLR